METINQTLRIPAEPGLVLGYVNLTAGEARGETKKE